VIGSNATTENAKHKFGEFLEENGIEDIVGRFNHPQTNGKIERFFGLVKRRRDTSKI